MASLPTGRMVVVIDATPEPSSGSVSLPRLVDPLKNVTVPVGEPPEGTVTTVAVNVTG